LDGSQRISSYRDLLVWQRAMDLTVRCYEETKAFPRDEIYGLTSQMRRSASSVAANIAEGYGRESSGAYVQFLKVAQGSLKELETHLMLAARLAYLPQGIEAQLLRETDEMGKMLRALIRSIQSKSNG
jgi:four helix bundle protein